MAGLKCNNCGQAIEIKGNESTATCAHCGNVQPAAAPAKKRKSKVGKLLAIILPSSSCLIAAIGAVVLAAISAIVLLIIAVVLCIVLTPAAKYYQGIQLYEAEKYTEAIAVFEDLDGFWDSESKIAECEIAILDAQYDDALALMASGQYEEAYSAFQAIYDYKDSAQQMTQIRVLQTKKTFENSSVGDLVYFGAYEQDGYTANGNEPILWEVLDVTDSKVLLISRYGLDCKPFCTYNLNVSWESSSLRQWLNEEFLDSAFSETEQAVIANTHVTAEENPVYYTDPGLSTEDKVFLLSISEAERYFASDAERVCKPTKYAVANGAWTNRNGDGWWWLRSPGVYYDDAACVLNDGSVYMRGDDAVTDNNMVRPAVYIDIS